MELDKNAEYHSAWCADHEKLYFTRLKNQLLPSRFVRHKLRWKEFI